MLSQFYLHNRLRNRLSCYFNFNISNMYNLFMILNRQNKPWYSFILYLPINIETVR